ncbi:type II toxin-antitoxin system RelE/ParE family toxin [Rhizobium wenxiniae]|nr:type II toxin-antitoxin system RelE/ParE family toxin [Rhizobium wenxiniae]MBW9089170.1 type II toxin-antitoxin system RelE/ParE family toxin [Rhizobium wenxiniae]
MTYRIIKHPLVEADLFDITAYISSYAGLNVGKAKVDEIVDFISKLSDFPKIGSIRNELGPNLRAVPASEKAVVCFTVDDDTRTVMILCISYAGSDWEQMVKERR